MEKDTKDKRNGEDVQTAARSRIILGSACLIIAFFSVLFLEVDRIKRNACTLQYEMANLVVSAYGSTDSKRMVVAVATKK